MAEPARPVLAAPAGAKAGARAPEAEADVAVSDVKLDEELVERAVKKWDQVVGPKAKALREAAQAHYDAINALRREQQRLIDEADRIQRAIDRLERQYQDMTTPQPDLGETGEAPAPREGAPPAESR
jgi:chromosome segregation ATPase